MASVILTAVGTIFFGPAGAFVGSQLGAAIDRKIFGAKKPASGARLADLAVQTADYGASLPLVYGHARLAGTLIWSTGLIETRAQEKVGSGKRATKVSGYAYSVSCAFALSARALIRVGRIWADGRLIREHDGPLSVPGSFRLYPGDEKQTPDPLIEAAVGIGQAPAWRGTAYLVFEALALAEFGNRLPNFTFEVWADETPLPEAALPENNTGVSLKEIVVDLARRAGEGAGIDVQAQEGAWPHVLGCVISGAGGVRSALEALFTLTPFIALSAPHGLLFALPSNSPIRLLEAKLYDTRAGAQAHNGDMQLERLGFSALPQQVVLSYLDPARDYQPSVQQAWRASGNPAQRLTLDLPVIIPASQARSVATAALAQRWQAQEQRELRLPPSHWDLAPGSCIALQDVPHKLWLVHERVIEEGGVTIGLTALLAATPPIEMPTDAGFAPVQHAARQGPSRVLLMELPAAAVSAAGVVPAAAALRLHAAVASPHAHWRQADIWLSRDGGARYEALGHAQTPAVMGVALNTLAPAHTGLWDYAHYLDVEVMQEDMQFFSKSREEVLNGANLLLVGGELIHFARAVQRGARAWRLTELLRGRFGTEAYTTRHTLQENVVLIEATQLLALDLPLNLLGQRLHAKALGPLETLEAVDTHVYAPTAAALRPLAPAHVQLERKQDGALHFSWIRCSRLGFDWLDHADVPLSEEAERYQLRLEVPGHAPRLWEVGHAHFVYTPEAQQAEAGGLIMAGRLAVAQISAAVGAGPEAALDFNAS